MRMAGAANAVVATAGRAAGKSEKAALGASAMAASNDQAICIMLVRPRSQVESEISAQAAEPPTSPA